MNYAQAGGDSGAPVFANGTAYGIHSGFSGSYAMYQGIRGAENALNVDVIFN